jgi:hypothetical protein
MNTISKPSSDHSPLPDAMPTLSDAIEDVPPCVACALDARAAEKQAFLALSVELLQQLRPEFDRLAAALVHRTLETAWQHKVNQSSKNQFPPEFL